MKILTSVRAIQYAAKEHAASMETDESAPRDKAVSVHAISSQGDLHCRATKEDDNSLKRRRSLTEFVGKSNRKNCSRREARFSR